MATGMQAENSREQLLAYKHLFGWQGATLPALATGTTTSKFKNTNTITLIRNNAPATIASADFSLAVPTGYAPGIIPPAFIPAGMGYSLTGQLAWPSSFATLAVSTWARYLIVADGTTLYALPSLAGLASATAAPDSPPVPQGFVVIGDITVKTDSTHTFIPGTTLFGAAGITTAYRDLVWPDTGPSSVTFPAATVNNVVG